MQLAEKQIIAEVAMRVLEELLFASSEVIESVSDSEVDDCLAATVEYAGAHHGVLTIMAPRSLCTEWADMLADDTSEGSTADVLAEVVNVIAGNWVSSAFPASEPVKLLPPKVATMALNEWESMHSTPGAVLLSIDDVPVALRVSTKD